MSETWGQVARQCSTAALELYSIDRWRAAINRFYCAAYSLLHERLITDGATPPGRGNWDHTTLRHRVVPTSLTSVAVADRDALSSALIVLFNLRSISDCRPSVTVDIASVKVAHSVYAQIMRILGE